MISIESVSNFRDVSIGSKMKKNLLFRCAKLSTLNKQDIRVLENLNPHAIIDFRDPKEVKMAPDNLSPKLQERYINLPISASTLSRMVSIKQINGDNIKSYEEVMEVYRHPISIRYIPRIFVFIFLITIMFVSKPVLAQPTTALWIQVPQWDDDWAKCTRIP